MLDAIHAPVPSVALFQQFVGELIALKWTIMQSSAATAEAEKSSGAGAPSRANSAWNRVVAMLNRQSQDAIRMGGPASLEFHREAMYVMAVLADETFLQLDWEGRDYWLTHLVEAQVFRTHAGGEIFFRRIEGLLGREDEAAAEIAAVYLFAIGLGFRGRYRGEGFSPELDSYRSRLFGFIARRKPVLAEQVKSLFPEAYRNTIHSGIERPIQSTRGWYIALASAFILWLVAAQFLWWQLSGDLSAELARINAATGTTEGWSKAGQK